MPIHNHIQVEKKFLDQVENIKKMRRLWKLQENTKNQRNCEKFADINTSKYKFNKHNSGGVGGATFQLQAGMCLLE